MRFLHMKTDDQAKDIVLLCTAGYTAAFFHGLQLVMRKLLRSALRPISETAADDGMLIHEHYLHGVFSKQLTFRRPRDQETNHG